ncbi:IclR family transcriptional regulator [Halomarina ordinaria]|uniref:IclR family transcriptional regulator n=1 Tax=Halomarina ordinaria TaxID=3033939 RepID=A0ABD5UBT4_9EURY|nr:IclR family transcriptional regulator [Halomarina sp. PSRA2]
MASSRSEDDERGSGTAAVQSVGTTLALIEALQERNGAGVTTLADDLGYSKSTVHKHLATLRSEDFVVKNGDVYSLGLRFLDVGGQVRANFRGADRIKQKVRALSQQTGELVQFITEERGRPIVLYREVGTNGVNSRTRVGKRLYLHQIAAGKAILANLPEARVTEIVARHGLPRATDATITNRAALGEELATIRERGVSYSLGESTRGLNAVAVPMFAPDDEVLGACVISGPSHRLRGQLLEEDLPSVLLGAVNELELNITYE